MLKRLNSPYLAAGALGLFVWLAVYANGQAQHGYTQKERNALNKLIDRETKSPSQRQVAGIVFLYGAAYE